jgi:hypothetical protein
MILVLVYAVMSKIFVDGEYPFQNFISREKRELVPLFMWITQPSGSV